MGFVYRRGDEHDCEPPAVKATEGEFLWKVDGNEDDMWFCDTCGKYYRATRDYEYPPDRIFRLYWKHLYGSDLDNALLALGLIKEVVIADNRIEPAG